MKSPRQSGPAATIGPDPAPRTLSGIVLLLALMPSFAATADDSILAGRDSLGSAAPADTLGRPSSILPTTSDNLREVPGDSLWRAGGEHFSVVGTPRPAPDDTSRLRVEIGARSDVTNESYYEDAFVDTTFLGRRRVNTPEWRHSTLVAGSWTGTRNRHATQYQLLGEFSHGDLLQRGLLYGRWKTRPGTDWTLFVQPTTEYRHDRTFNRDLEEWRGAANAGVRRMLGDGFTTAELALRGDLLRSSGHGADFLLDRNSAGASAALEHLGMLGGEWRLGYRLTGRSFPDSSERDHLEHLTEGRWRWDTNGGPSVGLDGNVSRRVTLQDVTVSRDNFWNAGGGVDTRWLAGTPTPLSIRLGGEVFRYDFPDSTLFFDYNVIRGQFTLVWERNGRWSLSMGPRSEILTAELNPDESYREIAAVFENVYLGRGSWWSFGPVAGWRDYDGAQSAGPGTPALHSSYAFYEVNLAVDQPLFSHIRLRTIGALRVENHIDPAQNAVSLYATGELRWR